MSAFDEPLDDILYVLCSFLCLKDCALLELANRYLYTTNAVKRSISVIDSREYYSPSLRLWIHSVLHLDTGAPIKKLLLDVNYRCWQRLALPEMVCDSAVIKRRLLQCRIFGVKNAPRGSWEYRMFLDVMWNPAVTQRLYVPHLTSADPVELCHPLQDLFALNAKLKDTQVSTIVVHSCRTYSTDEEDEVDVMDAMIATIAPHSRLKLLVFDHGDTFGLDSSRKAYRPEYWIDIMQRLPGLFVRFPAPFYCKYPQLWGVKSAVAHRCITTTYDLVEVAEAYGKDWDSYRQLLHALATCSKENLPFPLDAIHERMGERYGRGVIYLTTLPGYEIRFPSHCMVSRPINEAMSFVKGRLGTLIWTAKRIMDTTEPLASLSFWSDETIVEQARIILEKIGGIDYIISAKQSHLSNWSVTLPIFRGVWRNLNVCPVLVLNACGSEGDMFLNIYDRHLVGKSRPICACHGCRPVYSCVIECIIQWCTRIRRNILAEEQHVLSAYEQSRFHVLARVLSEVASLRHQDNSNAKRIMKEIGNLGDLIWIVMEQMSFEGLSDVMETIMENLRVLLPLDLFRDPDIWITRCSAPSCYARASKIMDNTGWIKRLETTEQCRKFVEVLYPQDKYPDLYAEGAWNADDLVFHICNGPIIFSGRSMCDLALLEQQWKGEQSKHIVKIGTRLIFPRRYLEGSSTVNQYYLSILKNRFSSLI